MLPPSSTFAPRLLRWYDTSRRDLPWRLTRAAAAAGEALDPYHVLVSEAMLQQTQVATVIPYFLRFLQRFPTLADLAAAPEQDVLRLWQGLGYYSRARNLQKAARTVVSDFGGKLPAERDELLKLPGIGRYTAGAVASIAFGRRAPIVDGNVVRVLCRLDRIETDPRDRATQEQLWRRAEEVLPTTRVGDFNSALMELGATVCTPRSPQCLICPVREHCEAFAAGVQGRIPAPRKAKLTPLSRRTTVCLRRPVDGRWLLEQRPDRGRWAGLWQFVTVAPEESAKPLGELLPVPATELVPLGVVTHALTHRRYHFDVMRGDATGDPRPGESDEKPRAWATLDELDQYPLPRPHLKIAEMLRRL
jgi:A/G-specific adenine glycosylase